MKKNLVILCLYFCFYLSSVAHAELLNVGIMSVSRSQDRIVQLILTDDEEKAAYFDIHVTRTCIDFNLLIDWEKVIVRLITSFNNVHSFKVDRISTNQQFLVLYLGDGKFDVQPSFRGIMRIDSLFTISNKSVGPINRLQGE